jgi:hypothetical protein
MTRGRPEKYAHEFWRWELFGWLAYGLAMFIAAAQARSTRLRPKPTPTLTLLLDYLPAIA